MIKHMLNNLNLRGPIFENVAMYLIRRAHNNNFVFRLRNFDSFIDLVLKYRLNMVNFKQLETHLTANECKADLVEFMFENNLGSEDRLVVKIIFYDVKSRRQNTRRKYFEECLSNHEFLCIMRDKFGCEIKIASIILFENWRFSFNTYAYEDVFLRIYDSQDKKTVNFQKKINKAS